MVSVRGESSLVKAGTAAKEAIVLAISLSLGRIISAGEFTLNRVVTGRDSVSREMVMAPTLCTRERLDEVWLDTGVRMMIGKNNRSRKS